MHQFLTFILGIKLYMFRTAPLSIIRSFLLYTHSNGMYHTGLQTACEQDQDGTAVPSWSCWHIPWLCVQWKLLMMDRGTVRNMWSFIPRIHLRN